MEESSPTPPKRAGRAVLAANAFCRDEQSSHDPSAAARKRRGPSVGMTTVYELLR